MKRIKHLLVGAMLLLPLMAGSAGAITIDLVKNGDFEANGGSLQYWTTYGYTGVLTEISGNHWAQLGPSTSNYGGGYIAQYLNVGDNFLNQTLSFDYDFSFTDTDSYHADIFASMLGSTTEILLASIDTSTLVSTIGNFSDILIPQLDAGTYKLKFYLSGNTFGGDSVALVDNVSFTAQVPEPGILMLLGSGLIGIAAFGRRRFKK